MIQDVVAAEVTRRILPLNSFRLVTSAASAFSVIPESAMLARGTGRVDVAKLLRPFLVGCVWFPLTLALSRWEREPPASVFHAMAFAPIPESTLGRAAIPQIAHTNPGGAVSS